MRGRARTPFNQPIRIDAADGRTTTAIAPKQKDIGSWWVGIGRAAFVAACESRFNVTSEQVLKRGRPAK